MQTKIDLAETEMAVKGSYNPLSTSPILSEEMYTIKVRKPELESPENYYGPLIYQDNVVGKIVGWMTPGATQNDINKLGFAIINYQKYVELKEKYREIIQSSPFVQWSLIPFLLGAEVGLKPITDSIKNDVKSDREFFNFLVQQGGKI
jgi:hypothetical protein